jgi:Na+-driven multidrug efflux pump
MGAAFGCFIVHPFLLRTLIRHLGFLGSALAIVLTQVLQVVGILLYLWWRPEYNHETWKGLSLYAIREALRLEIHDRAFLNLVLVRILSMSEWWFWEVMCMLAGHFGLIPLCSHTIAYNLIPICFMVALGTSIGLTMRMGHILTDDVTKAKLLAATCMFVTLMVACLVATLLWQRQDDIIAMFTIDDQAKQGCKEIWHLL